VARDGGWMPVPDLLEEVHNGDPSLFERLAARALVARTVSFPASRRRHAVCGGVQARQTSTGAIVELTTNASGQRRHARLHGAKYLAECIESVLNQTFRNFEYIIVNNCSTDGTLEIARQYARQDSRIRVHDNTEFVGVIANHNIAFRLMDPAANSYCKVVSGDDFIFPSCLSRLGRHGGRKPIRRSDSSGFVPTERQLHSLAGIQVPQAVNPGRDLCRQVFMGREPSFGFGTPTSILYRADVVRRRDEFYPNPSPHSDTSACFECLQGHGLRLRLSGALVRADPRRDAKLRVCRHEPLRVGLHQRPDAVRTGVSERGGAEGTLEGRGRRLRPVLAVNFRRFREQAFWTYHKSRREELGTRFKSSQLLKAGGATRCARF